MRRTRPMIVRSADVAAPQCPRTLRASRSTARGFRNADRCAMTRTRVAPVMSERPRERLLALGAAALTDAELLAVMLRTGIAGRPALTLAHDLLARFGGASPLLAAGVGDIRRQPGLGPARAAEFKAMVEFVRHSLMEQAAARDVLTSPEAVRDYLRLTLLPLPYEAFVALFLDSQNRLLAARELFRGTLSQTSVYPREVVKAALAENAAGVIFSHFVARHKMGLLCPVFLCAVLGGQERTSWASGQNRGT